MILYLHCKELSSYFFVRFSYINYVNRKTSTKKVSFDLKMEASNIILEDSMDGDNDDCNRKQVWRMFQSNRK